MADRSKTAPEPVEEEAAPAPESQQGPVETYLPPAPAEPEPPKGA
jgi:hypothetical protein